MKNKQIKYIGFYDIPESKSDRVSNLAAINKMNYISDALVEAGYYVEFVSPSWMGDKTNIQFENQRTVAINEYKQVTFTPSWRTSNKLTRNFKIFIALVWLFFYLLFNTKQDEKIIVYHVQWVSIPIRAAKFFKRFKLILEVEEIYGEVWKEKKIMNKMEKVLLDSADYYILVSDVLKEKFRSEKKESIILYGSYNRFHTKIKKNKEKNLIKLVYAGSLDKKKGGAYNAVQTMKYLPNKYVLHILGHGTDKETDDVRALINRINNEKKSEVCIYEGTKYGEEYSEFLSKCDIALNPQNQGDYMLMAFPSKIISYLSYNLRVVTTNIESIKKSSVSDILYFTADDKPENIAKTVRNVDFKEKYDSNEIIKNLHDEFVLKIKKMIEEV